MRQMNEEEKKTTAVAVEAIFASGDYKTVEGVFTPSKCSEKTAIVASCLLGAACFILGYLLMLGIKYLQH